MYRLPWAMEAVRVRATANEDVLGPFGVALDDYELGLAVPAVVTGTINGPAAILIQAGFNSRLAAIKAVADTAATFVSSQELRGWLVSPVVAGLSAQANWPTVETRSMWLVFAESFTPVESRTWADRKYWATATWYGAPPPPGVPIALHHWNGQPLVLAADGLPLGVLNAGLNPGRKGLARASVSHEAGRVDLSYLGPDDLWLA